MSDVRVDSNNTQLQASFGAVFDTNRNPIVQASAPAHHVTSDTTPPQLITFDMDVDSGSLSLTFDEPVDPSTLAISQISLQSTARDTAHSLTLTSGYSSDTISSVMVEITLAVNDLNSIKINRELAVDPNSTYISVGEGVVEDCAGISAPSISSMSALQVSSYVLDVTSPILLSFNLDLDEGTLTLNFDEPVNTSSLIVSSITIQNAPSSPTASLTLTTLDQAVSGFSIWFTISLSSTDLKALQNLQTTSDIAVNSSSSYLSMTTSTITDLNYNPVSEISVDSALRVNEFFPDAPDISQSTPGAAHILLSWSIPTGPKINSYTVMWERDTTGECSNEDEGNATLSDDITSYILTRLEEDSSYTITVMGLNAFGGAISDPRIISTLEAGK